jgi:hypothetical protein
MKANLKYHFLLLSISAFFIFSCSKTEDVAPTTTTTTSYISMKINGVEWKSSAGAGAISAGNYAISGTLDVSGVKDILVVQLPNAATIGVAYKLETFDIALAFSRKNGAVGYNIGKDVKGSSGVLTITKSKVVGSLTYANATFSGTAIGTDKTTLVITEGVVNNAQVN